MNAYTLSYIMRKFLEIQIKNLTMSASRRRTLSMGRGKTTIHVYTLELFNFSPHKIIFTMEKSKDIIIVRYLKLR